MHFFQFAATWLFPCAVCATMATAATVATDGVGEGSSSSQAFIRAGDVKAAGADPSSSPSASSTTSSSTSSLLGTRTRCGSPNSGRLPEKQGGAPLTPRGDAVRRCLRRLARRLQRGGVGADDQRTDGRRERRRRKSRRSKMMPDGRATAVVDGTAREREEAVASAIAYCKETTTSRPRGTPPPPPSPSLDGWGWLLDHRPEEIGSACTAPRCKCSALRRDVSLLEWLPPEAPACTSSAAVVNHGGCVASDECGGKSVAAAAESGASGRRPAGELGMVDIFDIDVLDWLVRTTNYFAAKYDQCNI